MIAVSKRMAIAAAFVTAASFPAWANNDQQNAENLRERQSRFDELKNMVQQDSDSQGRASEVLLGKFIKGYKQGSTASRAIIEKNLKTPPNP